MALGALTASAATPTYNQFNSTEKYPAPRKFRGEKPFTVQELEKRLTAAQNADTQNGKRAERPQPSLSFDDIPGFDYMEGPNGETWYYVADYEQEITFQNEYVTEYKIVAFTFTFYNSKFEEMGKVYDKIMVEGDQTGTRFVFPDPTITTKFFNDDDDVEVMIYFVMNTARYVNEYVYKTYSLGGEKDEEGCDVPIKVIKGICVESINATADTGEENYYLTFNTGKDVDPGIDSSDALEVLKHTYSNLTTFKKAGEDGELTPVHTWKIYNTKVPGDTTDGIYMILKQIGSKVYGVFSQYEKPLFNDPRGGTLDEEMTPDNSLVIEVYELTGENPSELLSTTKIPLEIIEDEEALYYSFLSIGSLSWGDDVDMSINGTPEAPAYIVAHQIAKASSLEDVFTSYDLYSNDGTKIKTIISGANNISLLGSPKGGTPQAMFVMTDFFTGNYVLDFIELYTGEKLCSIPLANDGDPIMAYCTLVDNPDGSYSYVFEMQQYDYDSEGNVILRIAWFDSKGKMQRIDNINVGHNVTAATANLARPALRPDLYDNDDAMEYAVLVKRNTGLTNRNEFMVVDDNQDVFITFSLADGRGAPKLFSVLPGTPDRIEIVYENGKNYNVDYYDLPFLSKEVESSGVENITDSAVSDMRYDGNTVYATGNIEVFNLSGVKVAEGTGSVSVAALDKGIYVVTVTDANGSRKSVRISR